MKNLYLTLSVITLATSFLLPSQANAEGISPQMMADSIHQVIQADRTVYAKLIVNRLVNEEEVIEASEHWQDEQALLLPAQMFRAGAEIVQEKSKNGFSYSLLSLWPINDQNNAKTEAEKTGLKFVGENKGKNYYGEETLAGKKYFTAVYSDVAVSDACVSCHNNHKDSPKKDFKLNDVMGGIVIRIPLTQL